ncbi:MAG TPA: SIMPL domain-containing protein, partial [Blastococcus sp.]
MAGPAPIPQVIVRGEAVLAVEPELAVVEVTVRARGRDRDTALQRCSARQAEVNEVVISAGDAVESAETAGAAVYPETEDGGMTVSVATVHTRLTVPRLDAAGDLVVALGRLDDVEVSGPG